MRAKESAASLSFVLLLGVYSKGFL